MSSQAARVVAALVIGACGAGAASACGGGLPKDGEDAATDAADASDADEASRSIDGSDAADAGPKARSCIAATTDAAPAPSTSGTRLKRVFPTSPDGLERFVRLHDVMLGEDCTFALNEKGQTLACLHAPTVPNVNYYELGPAVPPSIFAPLAFEQR